MRAIAPGATGLIQASRTGNREALARLLDLYTVCLRAAAQSHQLGRVSVRVAVSDLVQEATLEAFRSFDQFNGSTEREFAHWLETILRNKATTAVRSHAQCQVRTMASEVSLDVVGEPSAEQTSVSGRIIRAEEVVQLGRALEDLPQEQREAVRLRYLQGWTIDQLAAHFNRSHAAVAGLLKRGLQQLRTQFQDGASVT